MNCWSSGRSLPRNSSMVASSWSICFCIPFPSSDWSSIKASSIYKFSSSLFNRAIFDCLSSLASSSFSSFSSLCWVRSSLCNSVTFLSLSSNRLKTSVVFSSSSVIITCSCNLFSYGLSNLIFSSTVAAFST